MAQSEEVREALREEFTKELDQIADIYAAYEYRKRGANALKAIAEIAAKLNGERFVDAKVIKQYQEFLKVRSEDVTKRRVEAIQASLGKEA